jgi:hypothetical protein
MNLFRRHPVNQEILEDWLIDLANRAAGPICGGFALVFGAQMGAQ